MRKRGLELSPKVKAFARKAEMQSAKDAILLIKTPLSAFLIYANQGLTYSVARVPILRKGISL